MKEIQGKLNLVRVSASFELVRVQVIGRQPVVLFHMGKIRNTVAISAYFILFYFIILPHTMNYKQNKNDNK